MKMFLIGAIVGIAVVSLGWSYTAGLLSMDTVYRYMGPTTFKPHAYTPKDTKTYTDTAGLFSFSYPSDWTLTHPEQGGHDSYGTIPVGKTWYQIQEEDGWKSFSRDVELTAPNKGGAFSDIRIWREDDCTLESKKPAQDRFHTQRDFLVNNIPVLYDRLDFVGRSEAEKYRDRTYIFGYTNGDQNTCVTLSFREFWSQWDKKEDRNMYLPAFEYIVSTFRFLK